MKRVFICSRYTGDVPRNTATAERLCRKAVERGCAPFAPHLLYPRFLDDGKASEREAGIACGLTFMESCDEVWVFTGEGLSDGMRREVDHALRLGKSDVIIGLKPLANGAFDMYFIPTILIAVWGTKSKGLGTIEPLRNNYDILENCKNRDLILKKCKEYGII